MPFSLDPGTEAVRGLFSGKEKLPMPVRGM